ncbi:MAG TPA: 5'-3' exonuclease H3TH domain-containing protein, partial [Anaerolinea sp.]|nr:5'-3' exonuclease H3TH domain-containing protein [Anaerolinea sp.]
GVRPASIPDWLALVGDAADGFPGIPGWGAKSAAAVLERFEHLEAIPLDAQSWGLPAGRAAKLVESLAQHQEEAYLFRRLATLRQGVPLTETLSDLEWRGASPRLQAFCASIGDIKFADRITRWKSE